MTDRTPSREAIEQRVLTIIQTKKHLGPDQVTLNSTFVELGIDSLDGMDFVFEFEDAFNISISTETATGMRTVQQVVDALVTELDRPRSGTTS